MPELPQRGQGRRALLWELWRANHTQHTAASYTATGESAAAPNRQGNDRSAEDHRSGHAPARAAGRRDDHCRARADIAAASYTLADTAAAGCADDDWQCARYIASITTAGPTIYWR